MNAAGLLPQARYLVYFSIEPDWWESIDMADALHPQTLLAWGMNGGDLPVSFGGPLRLRVPRQLGYKSVKYITRLTVDRLTQRLRQGPWFGIAGRWLCLVRRHLSGRLAETGVGTRALLLPLAFAFGLAGLSLLGAVRQNPRVLWTFLAAVAALSVWSALLLVRVRRTQRKLSLDVVPRKQHYVQACAQLAVLVYWGWYWPPVYAFGPFILAQLLFAYAFDMLLGWSRRDAYTLGFACFRSSSASICSCGLSRTGSICSSRWWRSGWPRKS